jgi:hypothetical protein
VTALLADRLPAAATAFRLSVTEDPCFAMGHAGLALTLDLSDLDDAGRNDALDAVERARTCSRRVSRCERHHVEVVALALQRRIARASALGREHLVEFPDDVVVAQVLSRCCGDTGGAAGGRAVENQA